MKKRRHARDQAGRDAPAATTQARNAKLHAQRRKQLATHYAARYRAR
jgi:hypothetical protein